MRGHIYRRCPRPLAGACVNSKCAHRWAWTFSAGMDPTTGKRRQFTGGGCKTEREAWRDCRAAITAAEAGTLQTKRQARAAAVAAARDAESRPTVRSYLERWLAGKTKLRPNTRDGYRVNIEQHIAPRVGDVPLVDLSPRQVRSMLEDLAKPDPKTKRVRTAATIARVRATLTSALNDAVLDELIPRNPAARVPLPDSAAAGGAGITVWTPEQLGRFLTAAVEDLLFALYYVAAFTGLRRGELVGLRWADVELDGAVLVVRQSITQRGSELRVGAPKTKRGVRVVALDARTVDVVRRHKAAQAADRLRLGSAWADGDLVFTRADGSAVRPDDVTRQFRALAKSAGLPVIRLHDLRHSHASHALAAGVPIKVVSERLGHSSTAITENIYTHVVPKVAADAAEQIAALVPPIAGGGTR